MMLSQFTMVFPLRIAEKKSSLSKLISVLLDLIMFLLTRYPFSPVTLSYCNIYKCYFVLCVDFVENCIFLTLAVSDITFYFLAGLEESSVPRFS